MTDRIEIRRALVSVYDKAGLVDLGRDLGVALFGHLQRGQDVAAARALDVEQRPEAREYALGQELVQALYDALFAPAQLRPNGGKGALIQRKTAVQVVDQ